VRIGADGTVRGPFPAGLATSDVEATRVLEADGDEVHWQYLLKLRGLVLTPTEVRPRAIGTFGIGSRDIAGNEGRLAPPTSIYAVFRTMPSVPAIVYPPVNFATLADYHGNSWF